MFVVIGEYYDETTVEPPDMLACFQTSEEALSYVINEYVTESLSNDHRQDPLLLREDAHIMWKKRGDMVINNYYWYVFDTNKPIQQKFAQAKVLPHNSGNNSELCDCLSCNYNKTSLPVAIE